MSDPTLTTIGQILTHAKALGLAVFYSSAPSEEKHAIHWDGGHGDNWKGFLECAKSATVRIVYLYWLPFDEPAVTTALDGLHNAMGESDSENKRKWLRAQIESFREKIGLTACLELAFVSDDIAHIYYESVGWFRDFQKLATNKVAQAEKDDARED